MSIIKAVRRAQQVLKERNWDTLYWAVDLHGVLLKSNYENGGYAFINKDAVAAMSCISHMKGNKIIIWSSCHDHEKEAIVEFLRSNYINVDYFNCNPEVENTKTGCFDEKFYFSILLDDKAGFDPETDWKELLMNYVAMDMNDA